MKHCRRSLLYNSNEPWKKKNSDTFFDVAMGSYDEAEVCEIIKTYIQPQLTGIIDKNDYGWNRDDG